MNSVGILLPLGVGFLMLIVGFLLGLFYVRQRGPSTEQSVDGELADTQSLTDAEHGEVDQLSAKLESRRATITNLNSKLESLQADGAALRTKISDMENENAEIPKLRARLDELEGVEAERSALIAQIADLERATENADQMRRRNSELGPANAGRPASQPQPGNLEGASADSTIEPAGAGEMKAPRAPATAELDLVGAANLLGRKIKVDDLTTIEGIGPKTASLLNAEGISTWWQLSRTDSDHLAQLLNQAGPQFRRHDPSSWPEQAGLLAQGQWAEYKELTERLSRSRKT